MPRMYELAHCYRDLCDALEAQESGELNEDVAQKFATLADSLQDKARSIVGLIRELKTESDGVKEESDRLKKLATSKANAAERLKAYLLDCLMQAGIPKMDVGIAKIGVQKASRPSIAWPEEKGPIPEDFERWTVALDGAKAFEAHKDGSLPEGFVVKHTTFLSIR